MTSCSRLEWIGEDGSDAVTTTTLGLKILLLSVSLIPAFVIGMSVLVLMSAILISANEVVHVHVWLANTGAILTFKLHRRTRSSMI
jgi:hypothetical protein